MDHFVELDTIALVAITLPALTSILAALRGGQLQDWPPRFRLGFWMLVQYSLGALGFSLLPAVGRDLGVNTWSAPIAFLALFQLTSAVHFTRRHLLLEHSGEASRSRALWSAGVVMTSLTAVALAWSLLGGLGGPTYRIYHLGVVVCLVASVGAFVGFLRLDPRAKVPSLSVAPTPVVVAADVSGGRT